jgi:hypothetical protein
MLRRFGQPQTRRNCAASHPRFLASLKVDGTSFSPSELSRITVSDTRSGVGEGEIYCAPAISRSYGMSRSDEYRQIALECIEGARTSRSAEQRKQLLELGKAWMAAASLLDHGSKMPALDDYVATGNTLIESGAGHVQSRQGSADRSQVVGRGR